jgi:hypothetical protein
MRLGRKANHFLDMASEVFSTRSKRNFIYDLAATARQVRQKSAETALQIGFALLASVGASG